MKKLFKVLFLFIILFSTCNVKATNLNINSKNVVLYNRDSKEIVYEINSDQRVKIASLTKIMTGLVAIENIDDLDRLVMVENEDLQGLNEANLVTAGFKNGSMVTYRDLLYGLLLPSGADCAKVLARNVSSSLDEFIKLMNEKVSRLKLKNTHFSNVIGLDDEDNYSTASDMLIIFEEALKNEEFKKIIESKEYTTSDGKLSFKSSIIKNAKKYNIDIPYVLGGKTGTTSGAGLCLATVARCRGINYTLITLGANYDKKAPHHIEDAKIIYDYFMDNYGNHKVADKTKSFKKLSVKYGEEDFIKLYPEKDVVKYLPNDYKKDIKFKYSGIREVTPFTKGKIGVLKIYYKDSLIGTQSIYLKKRVHINKFLIIVPVLVIVILIILKRVIK